jgi:hypothetical protein
MRSKIIITIAAIAATANFAYAVDVSYEAGTDQTIRKDKAMSVKKGSEQKNSKRKFDTKTNAASASADVTFDAVSVYSNVADECFRTLTPAADFGLGFEEDGVIDLNRKSYFENAASGAMRLSQIDGVDESGIKELIACKIYNSARMAQANLILQKSLGRKSFSSADVMRYAQVAWDKAAKPTDPFIVGQLKKADSALKHDCRFVPNLGRDSVQCHSLTYSFVDGSTKNAGVVLSPGEKFFGVNSSFRISLSDNNTLGTEVANEDSQSASRDSSLTQTGSNSLNRSSKKTTNVSPFIPK